MIINFFMSFSANCQQNPSQWPLILRHYLIWTQRLCKCLKIAEISKNGLLHHTSVYASDPTCQTHFTDVSSRSYRSKTQKCWVPDIQCVWTRLASRSTRDDSMVHVSCLGGQLFEEIWAPQTPRMQVAEWARLESAFVPGPPMGHLLMTKRRTRYNT